MDVVVAAMESIAPRALAASWDKTGLLINLPVPNSVKTPRKKILLCIDLTKAVAEEAVKQFSTLCIIAYHPPIFTPLDSLSPQKTPALLPVIQNSISVYTPHTALDACLGGINDWILSGLPGQISVQMPIIPAHSGGQTGQGRIAVLEMPTTLDDISASLSRHFKTTYMRIARAETHSSITEVAVCAGAGASLFESLPSRVHCVITGELSHHSVLDLLRRKISVCMCEHDVSERGYLQDVLQPRLQALLPDHVLLTSKADSCPLELYLCKDTT